MSKQDLIKYLDKETRKNIAEVLDDETLRTIGNKVLETYEKDLHSMSEWLDAAEQSIKLASLKKEPKNTPFPNAANIKYPLITEACLQFAANIYPEIIKDGKVVKVSVLGFDPDGSKAKKADRVSTYMSYQLLFQTTEWEESLDKLLHLLPNIGFLVKKTYFDPIKKENCSELCDYKDIILNNNTLSLEDAEAITHRLHFRLNDLTKWARNGLFCEEAVLRIYEVNKQNVNAHVELLEQHRLLDLDDDGFSEPYIVTVEAETGKVLRIVPRYESKDIEVNRKGEVCCIKAEQYFTDFHAIPNPNGGFLSVGFGTLMLHLNESINTILNQLIDAGTLNNMQGGYLDSRVKLESGSSRHNPGDWLRVKPASGQLLKEAFVPIDYKAPSNVLLELLGMLIKAGESLSSTTEAMKGSAIPENAKTGAVNALLNRGLIVINGMQRRIYRSLKDEYLKLFLLNAKYMNPTEYINVIGDIKAIYRDDFDLESVDISPVADPNLSSDTQRISQIQVLQSLKQDPNVNIREINMRTLQFARISQPELILPPPPPNPPMNPELLKIQLQAIDQQKQSKEREVQLQQKQEQIDIEKAKLEAQIAVLRSQEMMNIAQAESYQKAHELKDLQLAMNAVETKINAVMQLHQQQTQNQHEKDLQQNQIEADKYAQQQDSADSMAGSPNDQTGSGNDQEPPAGQ